MTGMTQADYLARHKELCNEAMELTNKKNTDYADPAAFDADPMRVFRNFMAVDKLGVCTVEQGFLVRLCDKFCRLINLLRDGHEQQVSDESFKDTTLDIVNYVILLQCYRENKESK